MENNNYICKNCRRTYDKNMLYSFCSDNCAESYKYRTEEDLKDTENDLLCKAIEEKMNLDLTNPILKYFGAIRHVQSKNVDHNYFDEKKNIFYIFYLAGFKHLVEYGCGDLNRTNIHVLSKSDHNQFKEEFDKAYDMLEQIDKKLLFTGHLSISDKVCLDWACEVVDFYTYNHD